MANSFLNWSVYLLYTPWAIIEPISTMRGRMRIRTESKRQQVVDAAIEVFLENGYDQTLMEQVSERAGCSKGTLYSYFGSKEELYFAAVMEITAVETEGMSNRASPGGPLDKALVKFGVGMLRTAYSPRFQALRRLVFSTKNPELGRTVYERAVRPYVLRLAGLFATAMKEGQMRRAEPELAAQQLWALLEAELLLKFLLHALDAVPRSTLDAMAKRAVAVFWAAYRAERG